MAAGVWWNSQERFLIERKSIADHRKPKVSLLLHPKIRAYKCVMNICLWAERLVNYFWCLHTANVAGRSTLWPSTAKNILFHSKLWWLHGRFFIWNQKNPNYQRVGCSKTTVIGAAIKKEKITITITITAVNMIISCDILKMSRGVENINIVPYKECCISGFIEMRGNQ